MTTQPVRFYQIGSFAVGNRSSIRRTGRSSPAGPSNSLDSDIGPVKGWGGRRGSLRTDAQCGDDGQLIAVNAPVVSSLLNALPRDSWRVAWLHSLFGNAPAVATGSPPR